MRDRDLLSVIRKGTVLFDEPLKNHTSFRIGGCSTVILPADENEFQKIIRLANETETDFFIAGNGTNLLCSDNGFDGFYIKTSQLCTISRKTETVLCVGAGALLSKTAVFAAKNSLSGFEFAHGIPGTIGGAVVMNAGAYGGEMKDVVRKTRYISQDGTIGEMDRKDHDFSYRHSVFSVMAGTTVLETEMELVPGNPVEIEEKMAELYLKRKTSQPLEFPSAGSVFKRPEGHFVGPMIEQCGLKGYSIGGAQVSEKHAGFIINRGGATAEDVRRLIEYIRKKVFDTFGVVLECEIRPLGFDSNKL